MDNNHEFCFSREVIEQQIDALYELDNLLMDALAAARIRIHDAKRSVFALTSECLPDSLWKAGPSSLSRGIL